MKEFMTHEDKAKSGENKGETKWKLQKYRENCYIKRKQQEFEMRGNKIENGEEIK